MGRVWPNLSFEATRHGGPHLFVSSAARRRVGRLNFDFSGLACAFHGFAQAGAQIAAADQFRFRNSSSVEHYINPVHRITMHRLCPSSGPLPAVLHSPTAAQCVPLA